MTSGMEGTYPEMILLKPSISVEVNLATGPMKKNARPL